MEYRSQRVWWFLVVSGRSERESGDDYSTRTTFFFACISSVLDTAVQTSSPPRESVGIEHRAATLLWCGGHFQEILVFDRVSRVTCTRAGREREISTTRTPLNSSTELVDRTLPPVRARCRARFSLLPRWRVFFKRNATVRSWCLRDPISQLTTAEEIVLVDSQEN